MQTELKNLVDAVRDGRGVEAAMVAAQVQLLLANNPGKATAHDPVTAGPDDLIRRLRTTVQACGDAAIAPSSYTWAEVESICKAVILAIVAVGDGRLPFTADNPKPVGMPTVLVAEKFTWHPYPEESPTIPGEYQVQLRSGEYTWRATTAEPCSFPKPLDPMNAVVEWLG